MNIFVFDTETIPDVVSGRRLYDLHDLADEDTAKAMLHMRRQQTGTLAQEGKPHFREFLENRVSD